MPTSAALGLALLLCLGFGLTLFLGRGSAVEREAAPQVRSMAAPPERTLVGGNEPEQEALELLPGEKLDLNSATAEQLQKLPGIGEKLSRAIVDWREENGPFRELEELRQIPGIGEKRVEAIRDLVTLG